MTAAINLGLVLVILIMIYTGWQMNLYECAILVGRAFFAPLLALGLSTPLTTALEGSFPLPTPYIRAAATFGIWALVLLIVDRAARSGLKRRDTEKMRFHELLSIPGRLASGLAAGFLIAGFLALSAVMMPRVEGLFVDSNSRVVMGLPGKTTALYASLTGSPDGKELLKQLRVPAGRQWAGNNRQKMQKLIRYYNSKLDIQVQLRTPAGERGTGRRAPR